LGGDRTSLTLHAEDEALIKAVAVVGAGITGLTAATLLKQAGKTVALVESKEMVRGTSGYTTAKVTAGHRLVYQDPGPGGFPAARHGIAVVVAA
jgi:glycine/D-amino acid oxidase-like deaminating enzyme